MDLALEFGRPVAGLRRSMSEREFARWVKYANTKGLPVDRMEYYLAQLALQIARGPLNGAETMTVADFMIKRSDEEEIEEDDVDVDEDAQVAAARQAFGYRPRKKA
jgi:hypothetical protein